jgi:hypothetical protein
MAPGERAALYGLLMALQPTLSIEIGTASGGSLEPISACSTEVHSFDLRSHPRLTPERFSNVTFHIGDSHELLPAFLASLATARRNVDFVLVDGDHSVDGVRTDVNDLLESPSVGRTVIVLHDTLNESVREGLEQIADDNYEKVRFVDFDFVPGKVMSEGAQVDSYWSGLGLIVTGGAEVPGWPKAYPVPVVYEGFSRARVDVDERLDRLGSSQLIELQRDLTTQKEIVRLMKRSLSWRVTAPLRRARSLMRRG